jgi:hypothetical protein
LGAMGGWVPRAVIAALPPGFLHNGYGVPV